MIPTEYETKNAFIEYAHLGYQGGGVLTLSIGLKYGNGMHQSFGGFRLDTPENHAVTGNGADQVARVLDIAGVEKMDQLKGKVIRAYCKHTGVLAIGHPLEDRWYCPALNFRNTVTMDELLSYGKESA